MFFQRRLIPLIVQKPNGIHQLQPAPGKKKSEAIRSRSLLSLFFKLPLLGFPPPVPLRRDKLLAQANANRRSDFQSASALLPLLGSPSSAPLRRGKLLAQAPIKKESSRFLLLRHEAKKPPRIIPKRFFLLHGSPADIFSNQFKEDLAKIYDLKGVLDVKLIDSKNVS